MDLEGIGVFGSVQEKGKMKISFCEFFFCESFFESKFVFWEVKSEIDMTNVEVIFP